MTAGAVGVTHDGPAPGAALEVLAVATRLGLTSFGGPVAHLGYFREEYVRRRRWLGDAEYGEIVALCQSLPGPASSQTGIAIGLLRAGLPGAVCAWIGFTLPSAILMIAFAYGLDAFGNVEDAGWLHGLKIAAVAVVALAVWGMARTLTPDRERVTIAIGGAILVLAWTGAPSQVLVIGLGFVAGWLLYRNAPAPPAIELRVPVARSVAIGCLVTFFALLLVLPLLQAASASHTVALFDSFFRAGSLVFGGGHVVLPLLQVEVVPRGWVSSEDFLAGYGAAQAVPGPLFTFAAYLGAVETPEPNGVLGGTIALVAIFAPSFLLVIGGLLLWGLHPRRHGGTGRPARDQRRRRRSSRRRLVPPGLDQRHRRARGLRARARGVRPARVLEGATLARRRPVRARRRPPRRGLTIVVFSTTVPSRHTPLVGVDCHRPCSASPGNSRPSFPAATRSARTTSVFS